MKTVRKQELKMKKNLFSHEKQRFSIRKYSFGAASVLLGVSMLLGAQAVSADEQTGSVTVSDTTELVTVQAESSVLENNQATEAMLQETPEDSSEVATDAVESEEVTLDNQTNENQSQVSTSENQVSETSPSESKDESPVNEASEVKEGDEADKVDQEVIKETTSTENGETEEKKESKEANVSTEVDKEDEAEAVLSTTTEKVQTQAIYRLYNPNSGEHHYTASLGENNFLSKIGWKAEGIGWYAPTNGDKVYRLYNPNNGDHHYTLNKGESDYLKKIGWNYEGVAWYSGGDKPVYRLYNPNEKKAGSHHYTLSKGESNHLSKIGWKYEGIGWYASEKTEEVTKLEPQGTYKFTSEREVKKEPKISAKTDFTFKNGDSVNYDKVLEADGYQWISYLSYSGARRYVVLDKLSTTAKPDTPKQDVLTGSIKVVNTDSKGFEVNITNVANPNGIKAVKVPVWSTQNGQDDIKWYDATKQSNGDYKVTVRVANHKNNRGEYNVHLYYVQNDGSMKGVATTRTTVPQPTEADKNDVMYNGSYYSIQGKYDEIIIANKKYPLASNYNPGENTAAKEAFVKLRNDMINKGYNVGYGYSGFRSYSTQQSLYQSYANRDGQAAADRYSARAGYSEHQTGLAYDLTDKTGNLLQDSAATKWLKDNAHNYGFVVRYLPGKESVTGYMTEEWHVRYIGKEAKEVHDSGLTLEEYYGFEGGDYGKTATTNQSNTTQLPAQGTYTFVKDSPIKAEPKNASPVITYYPKGDKVNYTSVINSDGHQWLVYTSYSGAKRYVAID